MSRISVRLGRAKSFNRRIMNLRGVQSTLDRITRGLEGDSRARLAKHRKTGDHYVFVYRDRHTRVIALGSRTAEGSPMSVQFGHYIGGKWIPGLLILPTKRGD